MQLVILESNHVFFLSLFLKFGRAILSVLTTMGRPVKLLTFYSLVTTVCADRLSLPEVVIYLVALFQSLFGRQFVGASAFSM